MDYYYRMVWDKMQWKRGRKVSLLQLTHFRLHAYKCVCVQLDSSHVPAWKRHIISSCTDAWSQEIQTVCG